MNSAVKHLFIINPKSFWHSWKQDEILTRIHNLFRANEANDYEIHISRFPRDAVGFIPRFAGDLPRDTILRVYAVGGDGILFDCLNGVMGLKNVEIAVVPYGHTNSFVRGFGGGEKVFFRNLSRQIGAPSVPMDVMRCGSNYTLNHCVIGMEAEAVRYADRMRQKMDRGNSLNQWLSRKLYTLLYFVGALAAHFDDRLNNRRYEAEIDGESVSGLFWGISVFNGAYYSGNLHPANDAVPNDGVFDMLTTRGQGFFRTYGLIPFYISGRHKLFPRNFSLRRGHKLSLRCEDEEPLIISIDGMLFVETELDIELLPAAIQLVDASTHGYRGTADD